MNTLTIKQTNLSKSDQLLQAFQEGYEKEKNLTASNRLTDSMLTPLYFAYGAGNYFLKELGIVDEEPKQPGVDPVLRGVTAYLRGDYGDRIEMLAGPAVMLALTLAGVRGTITGGIKIGKTVVTLSKMAKKTKINKTLNLKSKPKIKPFDLKPDEAARGLKRLEKGLHNSGGSKKVGPTRK